VWKNKEMEQWKKLKAFLAFRTITPFRTLFLKQVVQRNEETDSIKKKNLEKINEPF